MELESSAMTWQAGMPLALDWSDGMVNTGERRHEVMQSYQVGPTCRMTSAKLMASSMPGMEEARSPRKDPSSFSTAIWFSGLGSISCWQRQPSTVIRALCQ